MFQTRFQSIPCVFILLQHSPAQRHSNNSFPINQLRTLFIATEGVPPPVPSLSFPPPSRPSPVTSHPSRVMPPPVHNSTVDYTLPHVYCPSGILPSLRPWDRPLSRRSS